jgi:hypothetical protein
MNTTTSTQSIPTGRFPFGVDTGAIPCETCGALDCDVDHGADGDK